MCDLDIGNKYFFKNAKLKKARKDEPSPRSSRVSYSRARLYLFDFFQGPCAEGFRLFVVRLLPSIQKGVEIFPVDQREDIGFEHLTEFSV